MPNGAIVHYTVYAIPLTSIGSTRGRRQTEPVTTPRTVHMVLHSTLLYNNLYSPILCIYLYMQILPGSARAGNITLVDYSITYQFRVSASVVDDRVLNEGELSDVTARTILFVPKPGIQYY